MFGYIILRDIPKRAAQLDFSIFEISGGFRGFAEVQPGVHYVSVEADEKMIEGFWCYIQPSGVVVKVYDYKKKQFVDDTPENTKQYSNMALSGSMNQKLIPVMQRNMEMALLWSDMVSYIKKNNFPLKLYSETPITPPDNLSPEEMQDWFLNKQKSRFEQAFFDTHGGNQEKFLAEFQYAYVRSVVRKTDNEAMNRWLHLLQSIYNAGERIINDIPELFPPLVDIIIKQLKLLPDDFFKLDSKVVYGANYFIEDMIDTRIKKIVEKAKEFEKYLESRGISH
ncbi:MAG: AAR2 pre-mRNA splicing protein [Candidatus Helarchaeota archaeon]